MSLNLNLRQEFGETNLLKLNRTKSNFSSLITNTFSSKGHLLLRDYFLIHAKLICFMTMINYFNLGEMSLHVLSNIGLWNEIRYGTVIQKCFGHVMMYGGIIISCFSTTIKI